jgi:magnesium transporter
VHNVAEKPSEAVPHPSTTLAAQIRALPPNEAAALIERTVPTEAVEALMQLNPALVQNILKQMEKGPRRFLTASAPAEVAEQWKRNTQYAEGSIGRLMEAPLAVFSPEMTVGDATEALRPLVRTAFVTYVYVVDSEGHLAGLVTMRDLLFNDRAARLADVMLANPFALRPDLPVPDAMKLTVNRHYPQYPVTDGEGKLVGLVRGAALFELEAFEITAQAGSMVGVEKEERVSSSLKQSFKFRNPWLLINLLTAFAAGGVVAIFQGTLDKLVILATFLPVLAGSRQHRLPGAGGDGARHHAGRREARHGKRLMTKEALLGLANGAVTGLLCGIAMYGYAVYEHNPHALMLGFVVMMAMIGSCCLSGVSGRAGAARAEEARCGPRPRPPVSSSPPPRTSRAWGSCWASRRSSYPSRKQMKLAASLLAAILCLAASAWAQEQAFTNRPTELKDKGAAEARTLATLPADTAVKVIARAGAWTQVQANNQTGFVRAFHLRFPVVVEKGSSSGLSSITNIFGGGNRSTQATVATTGIRGLSPEELKSASPDERGAREGAVVSRGQADGRALRARRQAHRREGG